MVESDLSLMNSVNLILLKCHCCPKWRLQIQCMLHKKIRGILHEWKKQSQVSMEPLKPKIFNMILTNEQSWRASPSNTQAVWQGCSSQNSGQPEQIGRTTCVHSQSAFENSENEQWGNDI